MCQLTISREVLKVIFYNSHNSFIVIFRPTLLKLIFFKSMWGIARYLPSCINSFTISNLLATCMTCNITRSFWVTLLYFPLIFHFQDNSSYFLLIFTSVSETKFHFLKFSTKRFWLDSIMWWFWNPSEYTLNVFKYIHIYILSMLHLYLFIF